MRMGYGMSHCECPSCLLTWIHSTSMMIWTHDESNPSFFGPIGTNYGMCWVPKTKKSKSISFCNCGVTRTRLVWLWPIWSFSLVALDLTICLVSIEVNNKLGHTGLVVKFWRFFILYIYPIFVYPTTVQVLEVFFHFVYPSS